jgi:hypothetical protein
MIRAHPLESVARFYRLPPQTWGNLRGSRQNAIGPDPRVEATAPSGESDGVEVFLWPLPLPLAPRPAFETREQRARPRSSDVVNAHEFVCSIL